MVDLRLGEKLLREDRTVLGDSEISEIRRDTTIYECMLLLGWLFRLYLDCDGDEIVVLRVSSYHTCSRVAQAVGLYLAELFA